MLNAYRKISIYFRSFTDLENRKNREKSRKLKLVMEKFQENQEKNIKEIGILNFAHNFLKLFLFQIIF